MDLDTRKIRLQSAVALANDGMYQAASDMVLDLVAEDWNCADGHRAWGRVLLAQGKAADAVSSFRTALVLAPQSADIHFELACALVEEGAKNPWNALTNWVDAKAAVDEGLRIEPDSMFGRRVQVTIEDNKQRAAALESN